MDQVFKGLHRRMSSFGKSAKTSKSPIETLSSITDDLTSSHSPSPFTSSNSTTQRANNERDTRLFSLEKLTEGTAVTDKHKIWFEKINVAVRTLMNSSDYDPSHDYEHIQRVVMNAHHLWTNEKDRDEFRNVDPLVVFVAAMVHDVADEKYLSDELVRMEPDQAQQERQRDAIEAFIKKAAPECPPCVWAPAAHIASLVSFTRELRNSAFVAQQCLAYPALQIVQDADRLDGLGALGVVRAAVYGSEHEPRGTGTIRRAAYTVDERHSRYLDMMKTRSGKREASKRWDAMVEIRNQIVKQTDCNDVLEEF
jgi:uncharacterized protein